MDLSGWLMLSIKSYKILKRLGEEYDFQKDKRIEARMRYLELTGRMKDDERLKWVQLKKSERQHHFRGEPNTDSDHMLEITIFTIAMIIS